MRRLIINPGTAEAWEIPLRGGTLSLGSGPENEIILAHPSVANQHCRVTVMEAGVVIKSLDSSKQTSVDGQAVTESLLLPGQVLRLGDIELCLEADLTPAPVPAPASPAPLDVQPLEEKGFFARIPEVFSYPFKGNGLVLLIGGTVFFGLAGMAQHLAGFFGPYGFVIGLGVGVFMTGYLFNFAKSIIASTVNGESGPPDWPDYTEWQEDILEPCLQLFGLVVLYFGLAIVLRWWHPAGPAMASALSLAAIGFGALLAPMGMMALALLDNIAALNPILLIVSIVRIPLSYLAAAAIFELLVWVYLRSGDLINLLLPVPVLPGLISGFLKLYLTLAAMRILGHLYVTKKDELGWFKQN